MSAWNARLRLEGIFHNDALGLEAKTEAIVSKIKTSSWYIPANENGELELLLEELTDAAQADDVAWWDTVWAAFYDVADAERVWVSTR
jgi:hypothetical protein